jgi:hypothetical protein
VTATTTFLLLFLLAVPPPATLDQVKAETNPERRARLAIDFAMASEKQAEGSYAKGDLEAAKTQLNLMAESMEAAKAAFKTSGRSPGRNPGPYKYAEQKSQELLKRLRDLDQRMDADERETVSGPRAKVQEIHDEWFEGIMERKK